MAREESDREDLLREATALVERVELRVPHEPEPIVAGFRRDGAASFFFGADPVFQFNAGGELRRAFVGGKLLKAEQGRLVQLTRVRTPHETQLLREEFDAAESGLLLLVMNRRLTELREALSGPIDVVGRVPTDVDVVTRVRTELQRLCAAPKIAASPRVGE
jgi:hypothetical protein